MKDLEYFSGSETKSFSENKVYSAELYDKTLYINKSAPEESNPKETGVDSAATGSSARKKINKNLVKNLTETLGRSAGTIAVTSVAAAVVATAIPSLIMPEPVTFTDFLSGSNAVYYSVSDKSLKEDGYYILLENGESQKTYDFADGDGIITGLIPQTEYTLSVTNGKSPVLEKTFTSQSAESVTALFDIDLTYDNQNGIATASYQAYLSDESGSVTSPYINVNDAYGLISGNEVQEQGFFNGEIVDVAQTQLTVEMLYDGDIQPVSIGRCTEELVFDSKFEQYLPTVQSLNFEQGSGEVVATLQVDNVKGEGNLFAAASKTRDGEVSVFDFEKRYNGYVGYLPLNSGQLSYEFQACYRHLSGMLTPLSSHSGTYSSAALIISQDFTPYYDYAILIPVMVTSGGVNEKIVNIEYTVTAGEDFSETDVYTNVLVGETNYLISSVPHGYEKVTVQAKMYIEGERNVYIGSTASSTINLTDKLVLNDVSYYSNYGDLILSAALYSPNEGATVKVKNVDTAEVHTVDFIRSYAVAVTEDKENYVIYAEDASSNIISEEYPVSVDATITGVYNVSSINPGDVLVTYNSDGTSNLYFDMQYSSPDADVYYEITLTKNSAANYVFTSTDNTFTIKNWKSYGNYATKYRIIKGVGFGKTVLSETVPSGTIEIGVCAQSVNTLVIPSDGTTELYFKFSYLDYLKEDIFWEISDGRKILVDASQIIKNTDTDEYECSILVDGEYEYAELNIWLAPNNWQYVKNLVEGKVQIDGNVYKQYKIKTTI